MQEADRHQEGTHIAYLGAPAHVYRVARYITQEQTRLDRARLGIYRHMPRLDKSMRIYEPDGAQWKLAEEHPVVSRVVDKALVTA